MVMEGRRWLWVAGGRDYDNRRDMRARLRECVLDFDALITGAASGADLLAEELWRREAQLPYLGIPAQWNLLGRPAGYRRNVVIADQEPEALLALPGGQGTQHARDIARIRGIPII